MRKARYSRNRRRSERLRNRRRRERNGAAAELTAVFEARSDLEKQFLAKHGRWVSAAVRKQVLATIGREEVRER